MNYFGFGNKSTMELKVRFMLEEDSKEMAYLETSD